MSCSSDGVCCSILCVYGSDICSKTSRSSCSRVSTIFRQWSMPRVLRRFAGLKIVGVAYHRPFAGFCLANPSDLLILDSPVNGIGSPLSLAAISICCCVVRRASGGSPACPPSWSLAASPCLHNSTGGGRSSSNLGSSILSNSGRLS